MAKKGTKTSKRDIKMAATYLEASEIVGLSTRQLRRINNGESENSEALEVIISLSEGKHKLIEEIKEDLLINAVNKLVPFKK